MNSKKNAIVIVLMLNAIYGISSGTAEEYMKRGATATDFEQALNRVVERKRGLVTKREYDKHHQTAASRAAPKVAAVTTTAAVAAASHPRAVDQDVYKPATHQNTDVQDGVSIYFGFNNAKLTRSSLAQLDQLGQALTKPQFKGISWLIEGHTDATGSDEYNQRLSESRAQAVQDYLIRRGYIDKGHLFAVGRGERNPYTPDKPYASINRRVRISPVDG
jgi:outer membrane protein OmpA-like peptidoglycan-associated protein